MDRVRPTCNGGTSAWDAAGGQSVAKTRTGQFQNLLLGFYVALRRRQPRLVGTDIEIGTGHLGKHADQHIATIFFAGHELSPGRFRRTADATEQVDLPTGIESRAVQGFGAGTGSVQTVFAGTLTHGAAFGIGPGPPFSPRHAKAGARFADTGHGLPNIQIVARSLFDESVEQRISEGAPPGNGYSACRGQGDILPLLPGLGHGGFGGRVIRTDGETAGQQQ
jgi:hypothetical protein